ncbi:MAG: hypothetical protein NC418_07840 [Muribaculaceae bacterium]|nr:hypothetical protein [Muribaculaceae bacterium]
MQRVSFIALLALSFTAMAESNLAHFAEPVDRLDYHLRIAAEGSRTRTVSMVWNYTDSANYTAISYTLPPRTADDPQLGFDSDYRVHTLCCGIDSTVTAGRFTTTYPTGAQAALSAVLAVENRRAFVSLGGTQADITIEVPFDIMHPAAIGYLCDRPAKELRNDIRWLPLPKPEEAPCPDLESLKARIAQSTDPMETFWRYLDRDTDPAKASLGGSYTLATVAEPGGSYSIILVDGTRLTLKGRLHPTIFTGHYDLEWRDAQGRAVDTETSAGIELDGAILRLNFPLHSATLRFSRAALK